MSEFERNTSPRTEQDIQADDIVKRLIIEERQDGTLINFAFFRNEERRIAREWKEYGFEEVLAFVDGDGGLTVISRFEDEDLYDEEGIVKSHHDVCYRFLYGGGERDIVVPLELVGENPQDIRSDNVTLYELSDLNLLDLSLREGAERFDEDITWLKQAFGNVLISQKPGHAHARLQTADRVVGVRLDELSQFDERDL